jgi:hypothetical protein
MMKIIAIALCLIASTAMARAPGESTAWKVSDCDHACLSKYVTDYMAALARRNPGALKVHKNIRFTENNVELPFGKEGFWATATAVAPTGLVAADAQSGNAAWLGTAEENGKPVYFAMRLGVRDGALAEVETIVVRNTGLPLPFADPAARAAPLARAPARGCRWLLQYRRVERRQYLHALRHRMWSPGERHSHHRRQHGRGGRYFCGL